MHNYDTIVIGAGLGGLLCAVMLAKEGEKVAVIEQNKQVGGCLQTFSFHKKIFDSCVHYIGAMDEGQTQRRIFDHAGIAQDLKLRRLDVEGFDSIMLGNDPMEYRLAQGTDNFVETLAAQFPLQHKGLKAYMEAIEYVADSFPLYKLRLGHASEKNRVWHWDMQHVMGNIADATLRRVLTGNSLLYAGSESTTPFYVHALVAKNYIDGAWKCEGGSSQIAKLLVRQLREYGGEIIRNTQAQSAMAKGGSLQAVVDQHGERYEAKRFIANAHPAKVIEWMPEGLIKPVYKKRIAAAPNSVASFMLNIVLAPGTVAYRNHNIYWTKDGDTLIADKAAQGEWPLNYALYFTEDPLRQGFAESVAVLCYMDGGQWDSWGHTRNITARPSRRPHDYHACKEAKAAQLLHLVAERFPEIKDNLLAMKVASPLTFRDYMGSPDGSMYGIMADVRQPELASIPIRTKIPNLLLTGQNIGIHGVLGVSINAVAVCSEILGMGYLLGKIN
ncbi:MAG: NAD(P)/FAD-dependent oxidoreductase [Edaphocola sp.]